MMYEKEGSMMRRFLTVIVTLLCLFGGDNLIQKEMPKQSRETRNTLTPMEALDLVKERYAADFEKIAIKNTKEYYYKLSEAEYYLAYEGEGTDLKNTYYLVHLYEFVTDDPETRIGHTVTYGWFLVDKDTGAMKIQT
jgi:hypothetical protein